MTIRPLNKRIPMTIDINGTSIEEFKTLINYNRFDSIVAEKTDTLVIIHDDKDEREAISDDRHLRTILDYLHSLRRTHFTIDICTRKRPFRSFTLNDIKELFTIHPPPSTNIILRLQTYQTRDPSSLNQEQHNARLNLLQNEMTMRIESGIDTIHDRIATFIAHVATEYNSYLRAELQRTIEGFRGHATIRHLIISKTNTSQYIPITTAPNSETLENSFAETILILDQQYQHHFEKHVNPATHSRKRHRSSGVAFKSFGLITCHGYTHDCWVVICCTDDQNETTSAPSFIVKKLEGRFDLESISTLFNDVMSLLQDCDMIPTTSGEVLP